MNGLTGGTCRRCWDQASLRIRARFASDTDGELRYSFHGHARPFHQTKRSPSRAETSSQPQAVGREETGAQSGPEAESAPTSADLRPVSGSVPAFPPEYFYVNYTPAAGDGKPGGQPLFYRDPEPEAYRLAKLHIASPEL